jgi:hypothetical protein
MNEFTNLFYLKRSLHNLRLTFYLNSLLFFRKGRETMSRSYAIMPRMPGLQLADDNARKKSLPKEERHALARAMGKNLALMPLFPNPALPSSILGMCVIRWISSSS